MIAIKIRLLETLSRYPIGSWPAMYLKNGILNKDYKFKITDPDL